MSIQKFKQYSDYKVMSQFASHLPTTESSSVYRGGALQGEGVLLAPVK